MFLVFLDTHFGDRQCLCSITLDHHNFFIGYYALMKTVNDMGQTNFDILGYRTKCTQPTSLLTCCYSVCTNSVNHFPLYPNRSWVTSVVLQIFLSFLIHSKTDNCQHTIWQNCLLHHSMYTESSSFFIFLVISELPSANLTNGHEPSECLQCTIWRGMEQALYL